VVEREGFEINRPGDDGAPGTIADPAQLRARREAVRMTCEEAAAALRLAPRQVEALENGDWQSLPGVAFVRGALRSYGRLLGADVAPLLEQVGSSESGVQLRPSVSLGTARPRGSAIGFGGGGVGNRWVWGVLIALGLIALAMFFAGGQGLSGMTSWLSTSTPPAEESAGRPPTVIEALPIPGVNEGQPTPPPEPPLAPPGPGSTAPVTVPAPGAAIAPAPPAVPALQFAFERDAWVDVRDVAGVPLLQGVQAAGSSSALEGKAPFSLVIGNAAHVRLERAGRAVTLQPAAPSGVARLSVE